MAEQQQASSVALATEEQVRKTVRAIIVDLAPSPEGPSEDDSLLVEALGYHSLALLELAFALEDEFELPPIDEPTARKILTVKNVADHVIAELKSGGRLGGAAA
jgi:acyl carrier protein